MPYYLTKRLPTPREIFTLFNSSDVFLLLKIKEAGLRDTAAIGTYTAFQSIATLLASSFAGPIWFYAGASTTFLLSGVIALVVAIYISRFKS